MKTFIAFLLLVACVADGYGQSQMAAKVFDEVGIDQRLSEQVPLDLEFRNEAGDVVKLDSYFHTKPVIISLVYYKCPMLCNQIMEGMLASFKVMDFTIGDEYEVLTVSIDPREKSDLAAEKKATFMKSYGRDGGEKGWHFLTGDSAAIKTLADAVGFKYIFDEKTGQFAHASGIMIATPEGKLARYLYGIEYGVNDLKFSLMDAAKEKIGSPVDKLLLLCFHYDPMTGKYGVVVGNLLRAGGVLTILILGGFMYLSNRREKQKHLHPTKA